MQKQQKQNKSSTTWYIIALLFVVCLGVFWTVKKPSEFPEGSEIVYPTKPTKPKRKDIQQTAKYIVDDSDEQKDVLPLPKDHETTPAIKQMLIEAKQLIHDGKPKEAEQILHKILELEQNNHFAYSELGFVYYIDYYELSQARTYLEEAIKMNSENELVYVELANIYEKTNTLEEGLDFFQFLQTEKPNNKYFNFVIGKILNKLGRAKDAINYLETAVEESNQVNFKLIELADAYMKAGEVDKSLSAYQHAIEREKQMMEKKNESDKNYFHLGYIQINYAKNLILNARYAEAEAVLQEVKKHSVEHEKQVDELLESIKKTGK